jgi:hypothetical protein
VPKSLVVKLNEALMSSNDGANSALQDLSDESESDRLEALICGDKNLIGQGLTNSKVICNKLGGTIEFQTS